MAESPEQPVSLGTLPASYDSERGELILTAPTPDRWGDERKLKIPVPLGSQLHQAVTGLAFEDASAHSSDPWPLITGMRMAKLSAEAASGEVVLGTDEQGDPVSWSLDRGPLWIYDGQRGLGSLAFRAVLNRALLARHEVLAVDFAKLDPAWARKFEAGIERDQAAFSSWNSLNLSTRLLETEVERLGQRTVEGTGTEEPRFVLISDPAVLLRYWDEYPDDGIVPQMEEALGYIETLIADGPAVGIHPVVLIPAKSGSDTAFLDSWILAADRRSGTELYLGNTVGLDSPAALASQSEILGRGALIDGKLTEIAVLTLIDSPWAQKLLKRFSAEGNFGSWMQNGWGI